MIRLKKSKVVRENKRAAQIFREVEKYLQEFGEVEKVDSEQVGIYALAAAEYEKFSEVLAEKGYLHIDKNGQARRRPETILRKDASETMIKYAKLLGIDRNFREKGREDTLARGRRPVDKIGKLRKVS